MNGIVNSSLLIDDDKATNFFNKYLLLKHNCFNNVKAVQSAIDALKHFKNADNKLNFKPNLIFLDINMPFMNGWDFLDEFAKLDEGFIKDIKIIMLSTSDDPYDFKKANNNVYVSDFVNKPLTTFTIDRLIQKHFSFRVVR